MTWANSAVVWTYCVPEDMNKRCHAAVPKVYCSEGSLVRRFVDPKVRWSEGSLIRILALIFQKKISAADPTLARARHVQILIKWE